MPDPSLSSAEERPSTPSPEASIHAGGSPPPNDVPEADPSFERLRTLLLAPERADLDALRAQLDRLRSAREQVVLISEALPDAIALAQSRDDRLARALAPAIESTLQASVARDPRPLADALFPVIGPAIRRSIAEALKALLASVNHVLEHSLSPRSLRWRFEAWRTGRSFAEVVLHHTLLYRVEQLFLIDRRTGLPLLHVTADDVVTQDGALVSSMLTAIQDFVQDSLGAPEGEVLDTLEMGDLTIWIEEGPYAYLAAVIRGVPAPSLRPTLKTLLEDLHFRFRAAFESYNGEPEAFEAARPLLESGLVSHYRPRPRRYRVLGWALVGVALLALTAWLLFSLHEQARWRDYVARLDAEPGIVVLDAGRRGGGWYLRGLRDPLATDPDTLRAATPLRDATVEEAWEPYQALDPVIMARRLARLLEAPPTVTFHVSDGMVRVTGDASPEWAARARERIRLIPGVTGYDDAGLTFDRVAFEQAQAAIESTTLQFEAGSPRLVPGQEPALDALARHLHTLLEIAGRQGRTVRIQILGHASEEGNPAFNQRLSQQRAEAIRSALVEQGLPADAFEALGTGRPRFPEANTPAERAANRSVSFRVTG